MHAREFNRAEELRLGCVSVCRRINVRRARNATAVSCGPAQVARIRSNEMRVS